MAKEYLYEKFIKCPYCSYENKDSWEYGYKNSSMEVSCNNCMKDFFVEINTAITYSSFPIFTEPEERE